MEFNLGATQSILLLSFLT